VKRSHVLVVDDESGIGYAAERVLSRQHKVLYVQTGGAALAAIEEFAPDLALIDIRLPEKNGFELAEALRQRKPDLDIIFMTGSLTEPDAHLVRAIQEGAFYFVQKPFGRGVLETLVRRCLELRQLRAKNLEYLKGLERQLSVARTFQERMLPPAQARLAGFAVEAAYHPCERLGGDFYDYAEVRPGCVALLVADVSGHGAAGAMLTSILKSGFHSCIGSGCDPLAVTREVRRSLAPFRMGMFVTLICARADAGAGTLEYVGAGHPPGLVATGAGSTLLEPTGPLIHSEFEEGSWEMRTIPLSRGARIALHSDGLEDARGPGGRFGRERLHSLVREDGGEGNLAARIADSVTEFCAGRPWDDDVTVLCARAD
jgi:sigma-B regulation protein RsbU (phosphoserine phosphatase)